MKRQGKTSNSMQPSVFNVLIDQMFNEEFVEKVLGFKRPEPKDPFDTISRKERKEEIFSTIKRMQPCTASDIAEDMSLTPEYVMTYIRRLRKSGHVQASRKKGLAAFLYTVKEKRE